jgi:hypothetical protein
MLKKLASIKTKSVLAIVSVFAFAFTLTAGAVPAQAAPNSDDYEYVGSFYWHESCEEAGKGGIPKAWSDYYCEGSGWPWDDYDLYVKYN